MDNNQCLFIGVSESLVMNMRQDFQLNAYGGRLNKNKEGKNQENEKIMIIIT